MKILCLLSLAIFTITPTWPHSIHKFSYSITIDSNIWKRFTREDFWNLLEIDKGWKIRSSREGDGMRQYTHQGKNIPISRLPFRLFLGDIEFIIKKAVHGGYQAYLGMANNSSNEYGYVDLDPGRNVIHRQGGNFYDLFFRGEVVIHLKGPNIFGR